MGLFTGISKLAKELLGVVLTDGKNALGTGANPLVVSQSSGTIAASSTITTPVIAGGLTASGSGDNDFSTSTGGFKTSTGANVLGGDTSVGTKHTTLIATGVVSKYNNESTAGVGQSYIEAVAQDVASLGSSTNLVTKATPATGLYRVTIVASAHTNGDTVVGDVTYTDAVTGVASTATVIASTALTADSATAGFKSGSVLIRASAATSIVARLSTTAQTTTKASAVIERLN